MFNSKNLQKKWQEFGILRVSKPVLLVFKTSTATTEITCVAIAKTVLPIFWKHNYAALNMDYEIRALTAGDESIELLNILQISSRSILWLRAERGFGIMLMLLIMGAVQISLKRRLKIATLPVLPMPTIVIVEELRKSTDK